MDSMDVDHEGLEGPTKTGRPDELLSDASEHHPPQQQRATAAYSNQDGRFMLPADKRLFDRQYASIYYARLGLMRPRLEASMQRLWPGVQRAPILNLPEGQEVAVVGTVYKDMKLKPSILDDYVKDRGVGDLTGSTKFTDAGDTLVLEDEAARMTLRGDALPVGALVTGVILAVRGSAIAGGDFQVQDVCYAEMAPQPPLPVRPAAGPAKYLALVSGFGVGDEKADPLRLSLVVDYLTGLLGSANEQALVARVARLVIAGGLMHGIEALAQATTYSKPRAQASALAPVKEVDGILTELVAAMPVDVMPGVADPANHSLPQQPLHRCLFPGAAAFTTFQRATNPHEFAMDGVSVLGSSGQNVDDVYKYSVGEDRLDIMHRMLQWGHFVPTAPDTLTSYPYSDSDPFIIEHTPHVLFAGNQPAFATRMVTGPAGQKVRLVCVPKFATTGVLVLINLGTLDVQPIHFEGRVD